MEAEFKLSKYFLCHVGQGVRGHTRLRLWSPKLSARLRNFLLPRRMGQDLPWFWAGVQIIVLLLSRSRKFCLSSLKEKVKSIVL